MKVVLCHRAMITHQFALNLVVFIFFGGKAKNVVAFSNIFRHWNDTICWHISPQQTITCLSQATNIIVADALLPCLAMVSTAMILTLFSRDIQVSAPKSLSTWNMFNYDHDSPTSGRKRLATLPLNCMGVAWERGRLINQQEIPLILYGLGRHLRACL